MNRIKNLDYYKTKNNFNLNKIARINTDLFGKGIKNFQWYKEFCISDPIPMLSSCEHEDGPITSTKLDAFLGKYFIKYQKSYKGDGEFMIPMRYGIKTNKPNMLNKLPCKNENKKYSSKDYAHSLLPL